MLVHVHVLATPATGWNSSNQHIMNQKEDGWVMVARQKSQDTNKGTSEEPIAKTINQDQHESQHENLSLHASHMSTNVSC